MLFKVGNSFAHLVKRGKVITYKFFVATLPHTWGAAANYSWAQLSTGNRKWGDFTT